jgi:acetyl-CoA C-acetyltransferase
MKEIGISEIDPRDLTLTGGLPYFGGPWSNYSLHAIATAIEKIQKNPQLKIMVVANGGYNTKQSFGIYGKSPPAIPWNAEDSEGRQKIQEGILKNFLEDPIEKANGKLTGEGYTITYNRDQQPMEGIVIGKINEYKRTIAYIKGDQENLNEFEHIELLGETFPVYYDDKLQCNIIELPD